VATTTRNERFRVRVSPVFVVSKRMVAVVSKDVLGTLAAP
jgi:hypothetical protein